MKKRVFITYIQEAKELAESLRDEISGVFPNDFEFFIASQRESIPPSETAHTEIEEALAKANAYIILCSNISVLSPWVNFETGGARISRVLSEQRKVKEIPQVFLLAYGGLKPGTLKEGPFAGMQLMDIENKDDIGFMVKQLGQLIRRQVPTIFDAKRFIDSLPVIAKGPEFHVILLPALRKLSRMGKDKLTGSEIRAIVQQIVRCASLATFGVEKPVYPGLPGGADTTKQYLCSLCDNDAEITETSCCKYCGLLSTAWITPSKEFKNTP